MALVDKDGKAENAGNIVMYWIGPPSGYRPEYATLFPNLGEKGGRELVMPIEVTPQELWDKNAHLLNAIRDNALRRLMTGRDSVIHPFAPIISSLQATWMFTSLEFNRMQAKINSLEERLAALEEQAGIEPPATEAPETAN
jgi:hypothetical protein